MLGPQPMAADRRMRMHKTADLLAGKALSIEELAPRSRLSRTSFRAPARFEDAPPIQPSIAPALGDMGLEGDDM